MSFISKLFGSPEPPGVQPLPAPPGIDDPDVQRARDEERRLLERKRRGHSQTLLTGGQGVLGSVPMQRKTLLGE